MGDLSITTDILQSGDDTRGILARMLSRLGRSPFSTPATTRAVALASASRTANTFSSTIDCRGFKGIAATLRWTTTDPTQTLTLGVLSGVINVTDAVFGITTAIPVTTAAQRTLVVYPGILNAAAGQFFGYPSVLLNECQLVVYHSNSNPVTYSLEYKLIP